MQFIPLMQFLAGCAASVSTNGSSFVLVRFDPRDSHLQGKIAKELGELRAGRTYRITVEEGIE
jgi:hypothetical protein